MGSVSSGVITLIASFVVFGLTLHAGAGLITTGGDTKDAEMSAETSASQLTSVSTRSCPSSSGLTGSISDHGTIAARGEVINLNAGDFFFAPTCEMAVPPGSVTFVLRNTGQTLHNLSISDQEIDVDVGKGETVRVTFEMGSSPIQFFCKYHRTSGMVGAALPKAP